VQALLDVGPDLIDTFLPRASLRGRALVYAPGGADWLTSLDELLERKPSSEFGHPGPHQSDLFEQYTRALQNLARQRPLLLVVDDLQWADPGSVSLLFHLGRAWLAAAFDRELIARRKWPSKYGERHPLEPS
jgi:hypothetical protein